MTPAAAASVTFCAMMTPVAGRIDLDRGGGMILIDPEDAELLLGRGQVGLRILLAVIGNLQLAFGDRALVEKNLGPVVLRMRASRLVVDRFQILIKGAGDVGALDLHEQLALADIVSNSRMERDHTAGGQGNNRNGAGDIGIDGTGDVQGGGGLID